MSDIQISSDPDTDDEAAPEAEASPDAESPVDTNGNEDDAPVMSPHQLRRRRLYRLIAVAGVLAAIFVVTVMPWESHEG